MPGSVVVGLTGGIGSGKSRVANLLEQLGAVVECSDRLVRELQEPGAPGLEALVQEFGQEYLLADGKLDRPKLGARVFRDADARRRLGEIIHPLVYQTFARRLEEHRRADAPVIVFDIPLLLEGKRAGRGSGALLPFDVIALVYARPETQRERIVARDRLSPEDALARMEAQLPIDEKRALADVVIENDGPWERTESQVRSLYSRWSSGHP